MNKTIGIKSKWALVLLGAIALCLCAVMTAHSFAGTALIGCSAGSGCDYVLSGKWSRFLGIIPVSALAAGAYAAFICTILFIDTEDEETRRISFILATLISGAITGSALWFMSLQLFVIKSFCKYCIAAHSIGIIASILFLVSAIRAGCFRQFHGGKGLLAGISAAVILAIVQILFSGKPAYQEGHSDSGLPDLSLIDLPVIGEPGDTNSVILLYDYGCPHCRRLHELAMDLVSSNPDSPSFILCPTPLCPDCNHYIPADDYRFEYSCDYAKLALSVWICDHKAFEAFDSFIWDTPEVEAARKYAEELVGADRIADMLGSEELFRTLTACIDLFGRTLEEGKSGLPRIVSGNKWIIPDISTPSDLQSILDLLK